MHGFRWEFARCDFHSTGVLTVVCFIVESSSKGRGKFATSARSYCVPIIQGPQDKQWLHPSVVVIFPFIWWCLMRCCWSAFVATKWNVKTVKPLCYKLEICAAYVHSTVNNSTLDLSAHILLIIMPNFSTCVTVIMWTENCEYWSTLFSSKLCFSAK